MPQYDRMATFFLLLNLGFLVYIAISTEEIFIRVTTFAGSVFIFILLLLQFFSNRQKKQHGSFMLLTAGLINCFTWMLLEQWWLMILSLTTLLLYIIAKRKMSVSVMKEYILYPSFPVKTIAWQDLSTVILKDGLLTLNFRSNRFIQQPVDVLGTSVNEQEFNEFCREQLHT